MSDDLVYAERLATGDAAGLLVLHHGRGADEFALLPLADMLDPQLRLHVVTPRAPLALADESGFHWYVSRRVGYPDADTFHDAYRALARLHDRVWERFGVAPDQTVLGGFSLGSGMSYSLGLGADRPPPAGILAFSGAIPAVDGWKPDVPRSTAVFAAHGRSDPIVDVALARAANQLLDDAGMHVEYRESDLGHAVDPAHIRAAAEWLERVIP